MTPGFQASQMSYIDRNGLFLLSNNSNFAFGFITTQDVTEFLLVIIHTGSSQVIWTANRGSPVANFDNFVFDLSGNAYLKKGGSVVWATETGNKGVSVIELQDSGNLVMRGNDSSLIWQSFHYPTDTLISNQDFVEGMRLVSDPSSSNLSYTLEIKSGDMILSAGFSSLQPYWSMGQDNRRTINANGGGVTLASFSANSWRFYDKNKILLWQFKYSADTDANLTWAAVLGNDGFITFYSLKDGAAPSLAKIPGNPCSTPEPCGAYSICSGVTRCQCPFALSSNNCGTGITSPCGQQKDSVALVDVGDGLNYFALDFVSPSLKSDLKGCKASCLVNCSCLAMFFDRSSGNCFLFDQIGSFQSSGQGSGFASYVKVNKTGGNYTDDGGRGGRGKGFPYAVIIIVLGTVLVICGLLFGAFRYYKKKKQVSEFPEEILEEDNFLENLTGMLIRFSYKDLQTATNNFSVRLGHGGFGSVYQGVLPDGTRLAVKKLEGIGQGKKEFRAEVSIIGSIHHLHLVRLKGFCAEGSHRLLVYEFMANGSLDKWIFKRNTEDFLLDWETRFSIALGTAKGLVYLHDDCDAKIIHCDIKPENVLLDDHFLAKVSDFGLAKLMTREQSHVFTTLRGTRGYLAPEWITNYAISEKTDVYSYGMLLLEIISGRKNYDPNENSEKSHFPSYAFKMMEEGKLREILDSRPSMTKVVQMLEGLCPVPNPPMSSPLGSRLYSSFFKSFSEEANSSGPSDCNSDNYLSAARLSGSR
ncbi:hypothetical protein SLEP1_g1702 [Rubroshorea leprosula]|uniref:Receptor-like serine/threonine-protein kinase n=1 Tax=Rubroshorea leprosula TaxID=152421 RepID=A0AAV5HND7_9ROSI|nr:hypothetical protein SLEP1_g1702 [Rubroshorea leprosula]